MRGNLASLTASLFLFLYMALAQAEPPAARILEARDHAELEAGIALGGVVRVALLDDRIARVIQAPDVIPAEHDPDDGDIYISLPGEGAAESGPFALFIGSEKGFTYRLTLMPLSGGSTQLLIRNPDAARDSGIAGGAGGDARIADAAALVRAMANREPLAGYRIERRGERMPETGRAVLEVWRGLGREAWLLALDETEASPDAQALAAEFGFGVIAAWMDDADHAGVRLAVIVREEAGGDR